MENIENSIQEDVLSDDTGKQISALNRICVIGESGKQVDVTWPSVFTACINDGNATVRKAAYATLRYCRAPLSEWQIISPTLRSDLCSFDPSLRQAVLECLRYFPIALLVEYNNSAPGQLWIGGGKDEPADVHLAAIRALKHLLFREEMILDLPQLMYDSWNYIIDRIVDMAPKQQYWVASVSAVSALFSYATGFEPLPDEACADQERPREMMEGLRAVARHVGAALSPHANAITDVVATLNDRAKLSCIFAVTHLLCVNKQMEDRGVFDGSAMDPDGTEVSPSLSLLNVIERVIVPSLYSHDPLFSFCAARCLLLVAPLFPTRTASLALKAVSVLATLLRNTTSITISRRILDTLASIVPRMSQTYTPRLCALVVEAASAFPDRTDRMYLLERMFDACVNEGSRPLRNPEVVSAFFSQPFLSPFFKDIYIRIADEVVMAMVHTMSEAGCCESTAMNDLEACMVFAENTWRFLVCSAREAVFTGDAWLRWLTKFFRTLFADTNEKQDDLKKKKITALRSHAVRFLSTIHTELRAVNNPSLAIGVIYILVNFLPTQNLSSIENCEPFYTVLRNAFMRMEDLERWSAACADARSAGLLISPQQPRGSPLARPVPVLLQSVSRCLCILCARSPQLVAPVDQLLQKFLSYYDKPTYDCDANFEEQNISDMVVPLVNSTRRAIAVSATRKHILKTYPTSMHLVGSPVLTLEDDFLWLGVATSRAIRQMSSKNAMLNRTPEVLVTGKSDLFSVSFSHLLNRDLNRMTLFVKITNASLFPQLGGNFSLETPHNMLPWSPDSVFLADTTREGSTTEFLSESITKLDPICSQTLRFAMQFTRFAPTRLVGRVSVAIAKNKPAPTVSSRVNKDRIMSISSTESAKQTANTPRKTSEQKMHNEPADTVESTAMWPELFTEPYVLSPFELTDPLPLPLNAFNFVWARFPESRLDMYIIQPTVKDGTVKITPEAFHSIAHQVMDKLEHQCNMSLIGQVQWGDDRSFNASYSFVSWFDDVFGVHVQGHYHPLENYAEVALEIRSSSLPALSAITPALIQNALFGDLDISLTASHSERPVQQSKPYSPNYEKQFARFKELTGKEKK